MHIVLHFSFTRPAPHSWICPVLLLAYPPQLLLVQVWFPGVTVMIARTMWIDRMVLMIHSTSWMAYSELPDLIELVPFSTLVVPHNLMEGICLSYQCYHGLKHLPKANWWEFSHVGFSFVVSLTTCCRSNLPAPPFKTMQFILWWWLPSHSFGDGL